MTIDQLEDIMKRQLAMNPDCSIKDYGFYVNKGRGPVFPDLPKYRLPQTVERAGIVTSKTINSR